MVDSAKKPLLIAESEGFSPRAINHLSQKFEVTCADLDRAGLLDAAKDYDVLWVRLRVKIDEEIMGSAPNLRAIVTNTTGLTHIDLEAADRQNIQVVSLKGETEFLREIRATAEHTIGLTLALLRRIPSAHDSVIGGTWNRYLFQGSELYQKTVGIIGYGRLGSIAASYFHAMGANVLVCDCKEVETQDEVALVDLPTLLRESEVISLHVNYVAENHHMLGPSQIAQIKSGAVLINTSRGELIDESALLDALRREQLSGAALDVLEHEHGIDLSSHSLVQYASDNDNLILTPHIGGYTRESLSKTELFLAKKLERALSTGLAPR